MARQGRDCSGGGEGASTPTRTGNSPLKHPPPPLKGRGEAGLLRLTIHHYNDNFSAWQTHLPMTWANIVKCWNDYNPATCHHQAFWKLSFDKRIKGGGIGKAQLRDLHEYWRHLILIGVFTGLPFALITCFSARTMDYFYSLFYFLPYLYVFLLILPRTSSCWELGYVFSRLNIYLTFCSCYRKLQNHTFIVLFLRNQQCCKNSKLPIDFCTEVYWNASLFV